MSRRRLRLPLVLAVGLTLVLTGCRAFERSSSTTAACTEALEALDDLDGTGVEEPDLEAFLENADSAQNERLRALAAEARAAVEAGDGERAREILERAREVCEQEGS